MKIIKINIKRPNPDIIKLIVKTLKDNKTVVIPTDTAYALAVNAFSRKAITKVFTVKNRLKVKPLSIMVRDFKMVKKIAYLDKKTEKLFKRFLPGPLTIILFKKKIIPDIVTANQTSIGIRIPDCKITKL